MSKRRLARKPPELPSSRLPDYGGLVTGISDLLESARRTTAHAINSILTATYWEIGRRIVEYEQAGQARAEYGERLLAKLAADLRERFGRGFNQRTMYRMRNFYLGWQVERAPSGFLEARPILSTPSTILAKRQHFPPKQVATSEQNQGTVDRWGDLTRVSRAFHLSWSHYVSLMSVSNPHARAFYETEAIRGGWSVRQLDRQIGTQFFERTSRSKQPEAMLARANRPRPDEIPRPEDEIRDPYLLEFLNLKDEYGESDLEEALVRHLEWFLLELGSGFTFVARQKRIRVGDSWFRIDLVLYHRGLRCLVLVDLKTGRFTHADAGQMNLYLNFAREQMTLAGENDPVGIILCSSKDDAVVRYATGGIRAKVFAAKYLTELPDQERLRREIVATRRALVERAGAIQPSARSATGYDAGRVEESPEEPCRVPCPSTNKGTAEGLCLGSSWPQAADRHRTPAGDDGGQLGPRAALLGPRTDDR